jgi:tetratricopeptide (TPR) repeat protein
MRRTPLPPVLAALLAALALGACAPKPKDYLEAIGWGMEAQNKGDLKKAYENYRAAYEIADKVGNGSRAVYAADLAADAAAALGKTDDAVKLLDAALRGYGKEASGYVGRFRMPNDLAVFRAHQKKHAEAKRLLETGLKPYEDKGSFSPAFPFGPFGVMSRNLALVLAAEGWSADAEAWYDYLTAKIVNNATLNHNAPYFWVGSAKALRALAELARTGPRAREAAALEDKAAELEAAEAQFAGRTSIEGRCYTRELKGAKQTVCMLELK